MTRIGITGHQHLTPATEQFAVDQLIGLLSQYEPIIAITSLATGADQVFAQTVLKCGGIIQVIVPSKAYRDTFKTYADIAAFDALLAQASSTLCFLLNNLQK